MNKIIYISAVLTVIFTACSKKKDKKTELAELKKQRIELDAKITTIEKEIGSTNPVVVKNVTIFNTKKTTFYNYIEIQGKVDVEQNVTVNPELPGIITAVYATVGQQVSKGQVLAQIDDKVLQQNIAQLQTQLDLSINLYQRQKNLWDQKIGTEIQFLNAKTQKEVLERQMDVLRQQQAMYKIKSPINGAIEKMDLKIGQAVAPGTQAIQAINPNSIKAKAQVAESYLGKINQGNEVRVIFPDIPDSLDTKISFAAKVIDLKSRSFDIEINLSPNKKYRANMITVLKVIDYKNPNAIVIPINAILNTEKGKYVFEVVNGKAKRTEIKAGRTIEGKTEVLAGLGENAKIVVTGIEDLSEGDTVKY